MSRRALRSAGSLGSVPPLHSSIGALRLPAAPLSLRLRSRFAVPSSTEQTGSPKFLGDPRHARPGSSTPAESREQGLRDMVPTFRSVDVAFRTYRVVGFHDLHISGPVSAARVLAVYASWPGLPSVATQDSLPAGGPALAGRELNPLGRFTKFRSCVAYMTSSLSKLSWRTVGRAKGARQGNRVRQLRLRFRRSRRTRLGSGDAPYTASRPACYATELAITVLVVTLPAIVSARPTAPA
jgi:hypothetical protein